MKCDWFDAAPYRYVIRFRPRRTTDDAFVRSFSSGVRRRRRPSSHGDDVRPNSTSSSIRRDGARPYTRGSTLRLNGTTTHANGARLSLATNHHWIDRPNRRNDERAVQQKEQRRGACEATTTTTMTTTTRLDDGAVGRRRRARPGARIDRLGHERGNTWTRGRTRRRATHRMRPPSRGALARHPGAVSSLFNSCRNCLYTRVVGADGGPGNYMRVFTHMDIRRRARARV